MAEEMLAREIALARGVRRFDRNRASLATPHEREVMVKRWGASQVEIGAFREHVKLCLSRSRLTMIERNHCLRMAARFYRVLRRAYEHEYEPQLGEILVDEVRSGRKLDTAFEVLRFSFDHFGQPYDEQMFARFRTVVEMETSGKEKGTMEEAVKSEVVSTPESTPADPLAKVAPEQMAKLVRKLRDQAAKLLAEHVGDGAEGAVALLLTRAGSGIGKGKKKRPDAISYEKVKRETALERVRKAKAESALRECLSVHEPVVKDCVALRLCKHLGYDEIARECDLTREDVADILAKLRPYVARFTTFFQSDYWWTEGARPQTL